MNFLGLSLFQGTYLNFLELLKKPQKKTLVFTPNPEILVRASRDDEFLDILKKADYLTPDANGLYVGSLMQEGKSFFSAAFSTLFHKRELGSKFGELIQGSNLTRDLVYFSEKNKKNILVIDNYRITDPQNDFEKKKMEIQGKFSELFHKYFPELNAHIVFDREYSISELVEYVKREDISYVFSCIGMKSQEQRLVEIFDHIPGEMQIVGLGVGSSFDYLLGLQDRAPILFQKLGLEWFYRLLLSPRKRWKRIHAAVVEFPRMIQKSLSKR